jgi:hypothetical protein
LAQPASLVDPKAARLVVYLDRERAFADLGIED